MGQHPHDAVFGLGGQQRVEQGDAAGAAEAGEEGVRLGAAARAVHDGDVAHGKLQLVRQGHDRAAQRSVFERGELQEQRGDEARRQPGHEEPASAGKDPGPERRIGHVLEQPQDHRQQRQAQHRTEREPLDPVGKEGAQGGLVEAEFRFHLERAPQRERQAQQGLQQHQHAEQQQAGADGSEAERNGPRIQPLKAAQPPEDKEHRQHGGVLNHIQLGGGDVVLHGALQVLVGHQIAQRFRYFLAQPRQVEQLRQQLHMKPAEHADERGEEPGVGQLHERQEMSYATNSSSSYPSPKGPAIFPAR